MPEAHTPIRTSAIAPPRIEADAGSHGVPSPPSPGSTNGSSTGSSTNAERRADDELGDVSALHQGGRHGDDR